MCTDRLSKQHVLNSATCIRKTSRSKPKIDSRISTQITDFLTHRLIKWADSLSHFKRISGSAGQHERTKLHSLYYLQSMNKIVYISALELTKRLPCSTDSPLGPKIATQSPNLVQNAVESPPKLIFACAPVTNGASGLRYYLWTLYPIHTACYGS